MLSHILVILHLCSQGNSITAADQNKLCSFMKHGGNAIVMHTMRRWEKFDKMGIIDVKISSKKPHSACTMASISIAAY